MEAEKEKLRRENEAFLKSEMDKLEQRKRELEQQICPP